MPPTAAKIHHAGTPTVVWGAGRGVAPSLRSHLVALDARCPKPCALLSLPRPRTNELGAWPQSPAMGPCPPSPIAAGVGVGPARRCCWQPGPIGSRQAPLTAALLAGGQLRGKPWEQSACNFPRISAHQGKRQSTFLEPAPIEHRGKKWGS